MSVYDYLLKIKDEKGAGYLVLIDPDKHDDDSIQRAAENCVRGGADAILVGGSLMLDGEFAERVGLIKDVSNIPVIAFPGSPSQVVVAMDAALFISIVSGRNPDSLIGEHVKAAPRLRSMGMETISTAYMLVESGRRSEEHT